MSNIKIKPIKIILLGDSGVGKSSIIQRFNEDKFEENICVTYTASFIEKNIDIQGEKIKVEIWDTVGQEEFRSLTHIFIKNAKIVILVYSVVSKQTFESLNYWYDYIKTNLDQNIIFGLAGNKTDLILETGYNEEVTSEEAKEYANKINANFALVSAKESLTEINSLFNELINRYLDGRSNSLDICNTLRIEQDSNFSLNNINNKTNDCCIGGKNKDKEIKIKMIFLGCNGVGKTAIIKTIKNNNEIKNINDLSHTKKCYEETLSYTKNNKNIKVVLKDTNGNEFHDDSCFQNKKYRVFFLVFNIYKKNTLYELENWINKINKNNKIYLLGYFNEKNASDKDIDFDYENEALNFAKKHELEYESITLDDIYKIKAIILENINIL